MHLVGERAQRRLVASALVDAARVEVVDRHGRVVEHLPAGALEREAQPDLPVRLRTGPAQTLVEPDLAERRAPYREVHALEHVDLARPATPEVVVADDPPVRPDLPHQLSLGRRRALDPVSPADRTRAGPAAEVLVQERQPVRSGRRVVVGERDDLPARRVEPGVHGSDDAGTLDHDGPQLRPLERHRGQRLARRGVAGSHDHHDLRRSSGLRVQRGHAAHKRGGPAPGRDHDRDRKLRPVVGHAQRGAIGLE